MDYVSASERLNPPHNWVPNFIKELWWFYRLRIARWQLETRDKHEVLWRAELKYMEDLLKSIGVDPDKEPEDWTRMFEIYLVLAILVAVFALAYVYSGYRTELVEIIKVRM